MPTGPGTRPWSSALVGMLAWILASGTVGCAARAPEIPQGRIFPEYSPSQALLFDDVLAPALFGFDPEGRDPARDPKLRDRTRLADFVIPARVESLTRVGGVENQGSYELTLAPTEAPLVGEHAGPIVLDIPVSGPSYNWVAGAGASFAGVRLIVFARSFRADEAGGEAIHFRAEPDTPTVRQAVKTNTALRLLK